MQFLKSLTLGCILVLSHETVHAFSTDDFMSMDACCQCPNDCPVEKRTHFGTVAFGGDPSIWYSIETNSYPTVTPLSHSSNKGSSEGGVYVSPTGFTIGEAGNYWVNMTAILQNPTEGSPVLIPVFLIQNESFDPADTTTIGGVVTLQPDAINSLHGTGTLKNIAAGTRLSLVATNAGYPMPVPVTVVAWSISLFKIQ